MRDTLIFNGAVSINDTIAQMHAMINVNNPSTDNSQLTTNLVTIVIALIAALIALYQVKSNIISSSRITWIENLREAISSYCSEVSNCSTLLSNMVFDCKGKTKDDLKETVFKHFPVYLESSNKVEKLGSKVLLYLNSEKEYHKQIEMSIRELSNYLEKKPIPQDEKEFIESHKNEIIKYSKLIFKNEWEKSKKIFKI